jgi:uncharacterized RDD family membrane protein YckC
MAETAEAATQVKYVGFWKRFIAFIIDSVIVSIVLLPVMIALYGGGYWDKAKNDTSRLMKVLEDPNADVTTRVLQANDIINGPGSAISALTDIRIQIAVAVTIVLFWRFRKATPGKMVVRAKIVNARTLDAASTAQLIGRVLAYVVSIIPFCVGFLWIAFDRRKQGWHDKLAGTVVIEDQEL